MFTMRLDAIRIRVMMMSAGLLTVLIFLIASGRIGGKPHGMIAIEWGAYPEAFAGLDVEVDGQVVGKLAYLSARAASGLVMAPRPGPISMKVWSVRGSIAATTFAVSLASSGWPPSR